MNEVHSIFFKGVISPLDIKALKNSEFIFYLYPLKKKKKKLFEREMTERTELDAIREG